jgi:hypothetical protein
MSPVGPVSNCFCSQYSLKEEADDAVYSPQVVQTGLFGRNDSVRWLAKEDAKW